MISFFYKIKNKRNSIIGIIIFLIIWELLALILGRYKLPRATLILQYFFIYLIKIDILVIQGGGKLGFLPHLIHTISRTLTGAFAGIGIGIFSGLLISYSKILRSITKHIIGTLRTIPPLAAIPFFIMWFGPTQQAQLAMLIFYCSVMLMINTVNSVENIDAVYINFGYTLGAKKRQLYPKIILPLIIPEIVGGIRVSLGVSWGIQIVTELMGTPKGMGKVFSMTIPMQSLDIIITGILWITLIAVIVDFIVMKVFRNITNWLPE